MREHYLIVSVYYTGLDRMSMVSLIRCHLIGPRMQALPVTVSPTLRDCCPPFKELVKPDSLPRFWARVVGRLFIDVCFAGVGFM